MRPGPTHRSQAFFHMVDLHHFFCRRRKGDLNEWGMDTRGEMERVPGGMMDRFGRGWSQKLRSVCQENLESLGTSRAVLGLRIQKTSLGGHGEARVPTSAGSVLWSQHVEGQQGTRGILALCRWPRGHGAALWHWKTGPA